MASVFAFIVSVLAAYLIGSFPTSYLAARILKGIDIREHGSKNVGATNVVRVVGKVPGFIVLIIDILKGVLVVTVIANFSYSFLEDLDFEFYRSLLGLIAICGHIWPVFLKFKGGKGIATTLGVVGVISPLLLALSGLLWIIVFSLTNYVSFSSILMAVSFPIFAVLLNRSIWVVLFTVAVCIITTYKHKPNIIRLLNKTESKIKLFNK